MGDFCNEFWWWQMFNMIGIIDFDGSSYEYLLQKNDKISYHLSCCFNDINLEQIVQTTLSRKLSSSLYHIPITFF